MFRTNFIFSKLFVYSHSRAALTVAGLRHPAYINLNLICSLVLTLVYIPNYQIKTLYLYSLLLHPIFLLNPVELNKKPIGPLIYEMATILPVLLLRIRVGSKTANHQKKFPQNTTKKTSPCVFFCFLW